MASTSLSLTPSALSAAATRLYRDAPPIHRLLAKYRPFLCPFHFLIDLFPPGANVLDVGCGNGLLLGLMTLDGRLARGLGFDASAGAIDAARCMAVRAADENPTPELRFEVRSCLDPWPESTFQVVVLADVMHHLPSAIQESVLRKALSRVEQGGLFVYKDIGRRPHWRALCNRLQDLIVSRQWISYAPIRGIEDCAKREGFQLIRSADIACYCFGHEFRVFRRS